nr:hypothetical protein [Tanacetum cinerariifolium]
MTAIFHELIEDSMEGFMEDFSVFGSSFDHCLKNLKKMLKSTRTKDRQTFQAYTLRQQNNERSIRNYTTTEKELQAVVFAFDKFHKYMEFDIEIRDKKGAENLAADHLSRLKNPNLGKLTRAEIRDLFPEERLIAICDKNDEPCGPSGGHHDIATTTRKVFEARFYYPHIFRDARKIPKALISVRGTHFCNHQMKKAMKRYGVVQRLSTAYHPQTNGQVKNTNQAAKPILEKTIENNRKDWSYKLDDALWAFQIAFKTLLETTPFRIIYGKACHLSVEFEHKAY